MSSPEPGSLIVSDGDLGTVPPEDTVVPQAFFPSPFSQRMYNRIPGCYRNADLPLGQPLYRWLSAIGDVAGELETLYARFHFEPGSGLGSGTFDGGTFDAGTFDDLGGGPTSDLVDPSTADPAWYPWIAQALNVRLDRSAPLATQQAQLLNASLGWNAGTIPAIVALAKTFLKGEQLVTVTQFVGDQWHYTISVYASQIIGETYAQIMALYPTYALLDAAFADYAEWSSSLAALQAALAAQNPAGMTQTISVITGSSYAVLDAKFTPYSALDAAFATYALMSSYVP